MEFNATTYIERIKSRETNNDRRVCTFRFHMLQELGECPQHIQKQQRRAGRARAAHEEDVRIELRARGPRRIRAG